MPKVTVHRDETPHRYVRHAALERAPLARNITADPDGALTRLLTVTASTKRQPAVSGGKRGPAVTQVASLTCTPLDPVDPQLRQRLALDTPHELLQAFTVETDIIEGDFLVVGTEEYPIRSCAEWSWRSGKFLHLVLEDLKR